MTIRLTQEEHAQKWFKTTYGEDAFVVGRAPPENTSGEEFCVMVFTDKKKTGWDIEWVSEDGKSSGNFFLESIDEEGAPLTSDEIKQLRAWMKRMDYLASKIDSDMLKDSGGEING